MGIYRGTAVRKPGPIERFLRGIVNLVCLLLGWKIIAWLWRKGAVGKLASLAASVVWLFIALVVIGAFVPNPNQQPVQAGSPPRAGNPASPPAAAPASPAAPISRTAPVQVGIWTVRLTGYYFTNRNPSDLPSRQMEWLVAHWHVQNGSGTAANLYDGNFAAHTGGLLETPDTFALDSFGYHGMPQSGFVLPGQRIKGTTIIPVFKGRSSVQVEFLPVDDNSAPDSHTWTISR